MSGNHKPTKANMRAKFLIMIVLLLALVQHIKQRSTERLLAVTSEWTTGPSAPSSSTAHSVGTNDIASASPYSTDWYGPFPIRPGTTFLSESTSVGAEQLLTNISCSNSYPAPLPLPGKKGIGNSNLPVVLPLNVYWNYDWGSKRNEALPDDIEYLPMIWGGGTVERIRQTLNDNVVPLITLGKAKHLLGFNEPDGIGQADMPVQQALDLWPELESMNLTLTSPVCANPWGGWMQEFMANATQSCKRLDWVGIHWYGDANFTTFVRGMTAYHEMYQRPILLSEFAPADWHALTVDQNQNSPADVLAFMKEALPWLEAQDWIVGYAWFPFLITMPAGTSSALFDINGNITALGQFYASVRTDNPQGNQSIAIN